ncbi:aspartyl-phosphate phosphatase Spo0E family protein [Bacillus sp. JJ722]|uniref:aspartyl-phosphate phosphatase Spo0E family protein n=1 Tax=Bacillus sp. JJ722 TaxID=3122973 RepID=UPI003000E094
MKEESLDRMFCEIQRVREEMVYVANIFGYTHERTIRISQELDQLMNEYHKCMTRRKRRGYMYQRVSGTYRRVMKKTLQLQILNLCFVLPIQFVETIVIM